MRTLGWIALAALVLLALFAVANWSLLAEPATLNFLAFDVRGPLGFILLGVTLGFVALFTLYALSLRTSALMETRRHLKELQAQRELADRAEASRFTTLGSQLEQELARMRAQIDASRNEGLARADALDASLKEALNETANALFAHMGQIDEKLERLTQQRPS